MTEKPVTEKPGSVAPVAERPPKPPKSSRKEQRRHARVVVRKVGPWSVFKMSVIFYVCVMLVMLGAGVILFGMLSAMGLIDSLEDLANELGFGPGFTVHGDWLFVRGLWYGVALVVVGSIINVFVAFLYNLISDLVGGVEVTLTERR
ncbi:MAG TPA: DUF3566 domain-containing protein [Actinomycetota bacterium]|nr:DUF3566 domain-containing protein [Actinomycetota bacterium]